MARAFFFLLCVCVCWRRGVLFSFLPHILLTVKTSLLKAFNQHTKEVGQIGRLGLHIYTLPRVKWIAARKLGITQEVQLGPP